VIEGRSTPHDRALHQRHFPPEIIMTTQCTASGTISPGNAVCLTGWDHGQSCPIVAAATAAVLATSKTIYGIAQSSNNNGASVDVLTAGEIAPQSLTRLTTGAGMSRLVVTKLDSDDPGLRHLDDGPPVEERFVVGTSDENGNVVIQPRHFSGDTGFRKVFNVRAFGAVPDWSRGRTGTITMGADALKVSDASDLRVGQKLLIGDNTDTYQISAISGTNVTLGARVARGATDGRVVVDNLPYFQAALAAMKAVESTGYHNKSGRLVADGHFYLHGTLAITQTVHFDGSGFGEPESPAVDSGRSSPGTWLVFPPNTTGIRIYSTALTDDNPTSGSGERTTLSDITLSCSGPREDVTHGNTTGCAVHATIVCSLRQLNIHGFAEHGVLLVGDADIPVPQGNTHTTYVENVVVGSCGLDGFHALGLDASTTTFINCSAFGCGRFGFSDGSAMNAYVMCLGQGNCSANRDWGEVTGTIDAESYELVVNTAWGMEVNDYLVVSGMGLAGAAAYPKIVEINGTRITLDTPAATAATNVAVLVGCNYRAKYPINMSSFVGCYSEEGPPNQFYAPVNIFGGGAQAGGPAALGFDFQNGTAHHAPIRYLNDRGRRPVYAQLGCLGPTPNIVFMWGVESVDDTSLELTDNGVEARGHMWWSLQNQVSANRTLMRFPTLASAARHPAPWLTNGVFIGRDDLVPSSSPYPMHFTAAPWPSFFATLESPPFTDYTGASGQTYRVGDVVWNSTPVSAGGSLGTPQGMVCTVKGTGTLNHSELNAGNTRGTTLGGLAPSQLQVDAEAGLRKGMLIVIPGEAEPCYEVTSDPVEYGGNYLVHIAPDATVGVTNVVIAYSPAAFALFGRFDGNTINPDDHYEAKPCEHIVMVTSGNTVLLPAAPADDNEVTIINMSGGSIVVDFNGGTVYGLGATSESLADDASCLYRFVGGGVNKWKRCAV
jgi:hypothetical protein